MSEFQAYLNGTYLPLSQAKLAVSDLGIVYGAAVTEMIRTFNQRPFLLDEHLDRLFAALEYTCIAAPLSRTELKTICLQLIEQNAPLLPAEHDLGVTVFVTAGQNLPYLGLAEREVCQTPTVCVHTFPLVFELWDQKYVQGQYLIRSEVEQLNSRIFDPRVKSRSRIHLYRADKLIRQQTPEASALLFDENGYVAETTIGNFYLVVDGELLTPRPEQVLGGISQLMVIRLAKQLGLKYVETDVSEEQIFQAEEALTSSTGYCLMPVTRYNDALLSEGKPGPVFQQLISTWSQEVGLDIVKQAGQIGAARRKSLS